MACKIKEWGRLEDGRPVKLYTLTNDGGVSASFTDLGGTWVSMLVKSRDGRMVDVVLGYDGVSGYLDNRPHFGAPIGRYANRIGGAKFMLNGREYCLEANNGPNNLHSGPDYYHDRLWEAETEETGLGTRIRFSLKSPDGDQGYPGSADICVAYTLTGDDSLMIEYHMVSDADTVANFTNHSYFNLSGHDRGKVLGQRVWIDADAYTRADAVSIPTGEITPVQGTPMDFREMKAVGRDIEEDYEALILGKGYDHNWILNHPAGELALCAAAESEETKIRMEVYTDLPGMQFYTANFLDEGTKGKGGAVYGPWCAYCFETQYYPNAINMPQFPSPVLRAGEEYQTATIYKFSVVK